jgi:hypothetical protein
MFKEQQALPVRLAGCGFAPFLVCFVLCLAMQLGAVWMAVELLQLTSVLIDPNYFQREGPQLQSEITFCRQLKDLVREKKSSKHAPSLHVMGKIFLGPISRVVFDFCVLVHFVAVLVTYGMFYTFGRIVTVLIVLTIRAALAGSESYAQMFGLEYRNLIAPFVLFFGAAVLFGSHALQPVISSLTVIKCVLLIGMIGVVGFVGSNTSIFSVNRFMQNISRSLFPTPHSSGERMVQHWATVSDWYNCLRWSCKCTPSYV